MKKNNSNTFVILRMAVFFMLLTIAGCNSLDRPGGSPAVQPEDTGEEDHLTTVTLTPEQIKNAGIRLGNMETRTLEGKLRVNGLVEVPPQGKISVTFPFGGSVQKIMVSEGDYVKRGVLLAVLTNPEYIDFQESYLKNKSALDYARLEYQRQKALFDADVAAEKSFEKAQSDYKSLNATVQAMTQKLKILGISAETLTPDNIRTTINIFAPDNGYVAKISANMGKFVNAQEELLEINNTQNILLALTVYERDLDQVQAGMEISFTVSGGGTMPQKGKITLLGREVGADRSLTVYAVPYDGSRRLIPGAYVQADILRPGRVPDVVPLEAIVRSGGNVYIFVKEKNDSGSFTMVPVQQGAQDLSYSQIRLPQGFQVRDSSVVLQGAFALLSAMKNTNDDH